MDGDGEDEPFNKGHHLSYGADDISGQDTSTSLPITASAFSPLKGGPDETAGVDVKEGGDDFDEKYGGMEDDLLTKSIQAPDEPPPCLTWLQRIMFGLPQFNINYGNALLNVSPQTTPHPFSALTHPPVLPISPG